MNGISGLNLATGALDVFSGGIQTSAHNIANVSTEGFQPLRADYATGPGGQGVRMDAIRKDSSGLEANEMRELSDNNIKRPSGTELAKEFTLMIRNEHAFAANVKVIETLDANLGTLLDATT